MEVDESEEKSEDDGDKKRDEEAEALPTPVPPRAVLLPALYALSMSSWFISIVSPPSSSSGSCSSRSTSYLSAAPLLSHPLSLSSVSYSP